MAPPGESRTRATSTAGTAEGSRGRSLRTAGFSLLELLVVLVILAIASAFAVPAVRSGWESREIRQGTRQLASVMRGLRERAVRRGEEIDLVINEDGQTITWAGASEAMRLPSGAWVTGVHGGWPDQDGSVRVIFYPNGGATGVAFMIGGRDDDGLRFAIQIDALLGTVSIEEATLR